MKIKKPRWEFQPLVERTIVKGLWDVTKTLWRTKHPPSTSGICAVKQNTQFPSLLWNYIKTESKRNNWCCQIKLEWKDHFHQRPSTAERKPNTIKMHFGVIFSTYQNNSHKTPQAQAAIELIISVLFKILLPKNLKHLWGFPQLCCSF